MKRIAGILNFDHTPVDSDALGRMTRAMNILGQDWRYTWTEGEIGLGCAIIGDTSRENYASLPYHHPNERWVINFDGRIDNRQELLSVLKSQPVVNRPPISNEKIVLAAYEKWGQECPKHLIGDFAFAIWDRKNHTLICARDHFGVKPLYYSLSHQSFVFASTPYALLASGKVPLTIHEERIADFLVNPLEGVDKISSFYTGVFRLAPAHLLVIQPEGLSEQCYWQLVPKLNTAAMTEADYIEAFQELFKEAIRCRLQDTSAPASMLSGGMDSSAIVGIGRKILVEEGKPLHAFSVISKSSGVNRETPYILSVLNQGNLISHLISEIELQQRMDELIRVLESEDEPFDCLMNLNRAVYLHTQDHGINSLLDGIDGDTLLSSSGHLSHLWRQGAYRTIISETLKANGLTAEYKLGRNYFFNSILSVFTPVAPEWFRSLRKPYRYKKAVTLALKESIIEREFAQQSYLGERLARLDSHKPRPRSFSQVEFHKIALNHPFLTVGLERYERVASAFGIEARHPYVDVRLAEFCLELPWQLKTQRGWTKMILRRALEQELPSEVIWRKDKDSLMWEVNRLILKERAEYFYQITFDEQANLKPYVDIGKLMEYWDDYLILGEEKHAELLWSGIALAMWLRHQRNTNVYLQ